MLLTVDHMSPTYRYDRPVRGVVQSHRLTPSVFDGQKVIGLDGHGRRAAPRAGRSATGRATGSRAGRCAARSSEIEVRVEGQVETTDLAGILRGHRETVPPEAYLRETVPTARRCRVDRAGARGRWAMPMTRWTRRIGCPRRSPTPSPTGPARPMPTPPRPRRWRRARASARTTPMP